MATLASQMLTDIDDVFLNTSEHAETITYTASGGSPASIPAIVDRMEDVMPTGFDDGRARLKRCVIHVAESDVATVTQGVHASLGDTFTIDSTTWKIEGQPQHIGGMRILNLVQTTVFEKSDGNYRIQR